MGAMLHLAHVHQQPARNRRPKRTGDGDGNRFAGLARRIYRDGRADPQSRELLLAVAYTLTMAPLDGEISEWQVTARALGPDRSGNNRLPDLLRHDIPCYSSSAYSEPLSRVCGGPRVRPHPVPDSVENRLGICGAAAGQYALEKLPETGWYKYHWFCARHRDRLRMVRAHVEAGNVMAPEPIPNKGGLLPCYFESDWVAVYRAVSYAGEKWEPPVYGVRADEWPVPGRDAARPARPRLRLVADSVSGE